MAKIAVALSGGVDSSVALMLLKEAGHDLIGVTMRHLNDECFDLWEGSCCSRAAVMSASRLCKKYGIKHYIFELEKEFEEKVLAPTALTYASGKTPNPCCDCNEEIKFGMMFEKAREKGAEMIATGHYALCNDGMLFSARDKKRDQSYFLYRLSSEVLRKTIFPLGELTKDEVRELAKKYYLESKDSKDSMEICFAPNKDFTKVFERFAPSALMPGDILDETGSIIGRHNGIGKITVGQRKGLGLRDYQDKYVIELNASENSIRVGNRPISKELSVSKLVMRAAKKKFRAVVKIRSQHKGSWAEIIIADEDTAKVIFDELQENVTPGQACVFYDGDLVLGGGVIQ